MSKKKEGFLPIKTNTFDRYFISVVLFIALSLFWMRFLEASLPLWISTIISLLVGQWIIRKG